MKWVFFFPSRNKNTIIINSIDTINNHHVILSSDNLLTSDLIHPDIRVQLDDQVANMITTMNNNWDIYEFATTINKL